MESIKRDGLQLFFEVLGEGPDVVLLHPFPSCHELWLPLAKPLSSRYRVILPDLRAHGRSGVPDRPALMSDYVADIDAICRELKVGQAIFAGASIGGYILFELWRTSPERIKALAFFCTKAAADSPEAKSARLQSAEDVLQRGSAQFVDSMMPKLLGATTLRSRKDIETVARATMRLVSPLGIAMVQRGMAERPDSTPTLDTIKVPTMFIAGEEDVSAPPEEMRRMHDTVRGSRFAAIPRSGHYAALEAPEECFRLLRTFCDRNS